MLFRSDIKSAPALFSIRRPCTWITFAGFSRSSVVVEIGWFYTQARWLPRLRLSTWLVLASALMTLRMALTAGGGAWLWLLMVAQLLHAVTFAAGLAAAATELGSEVMVIEVAPRIMARACDEETGAAILAEHQHHDDDREGEGARHDRLAERRHL